MAVIMPDYIVWAAGAIERGARSVDECDQR